LVLFTGCSLVKIEPVVVKEEIHSEKISEIQKVEPLEEVEKKVKETPIEVIEKVFSDELFFEIDKMHANKNLLTIKYLDASPSEKRALNLTYSRYKKIWSEEQSEEFKLIIQEDKYLSLCSDKKYWNNLEFENEPEKREILSSILLLRYLNNLTHGCEKWVKSNGKIKEENRDKQIDANHLLSLLPHGLLIEKIIQKFLPQEERFLSRVEEYHFLVDSTQNSSNLKEMRLEIERLKSISMRPNYSKKEEK